MKFCSKPIEDDKSIKTKTGLDHPQSFFW